MTAFDIAATDQAFAIGTNQNVVNLYATHDKYNINPSSKQPEFADANMAYQYYSLVNDCYTPVSEISPFPYYEFNQVASHRELLSFMPPHTTNRTYRPVPPVSAEVLSSMRLVGNIGYVANTPGIIQNPTSLPANGTISRRNFFFLFCLRLKFLFIQLQIVPKVMNSARTRCLSGIIFLSPITTKWIRTSTISRATIIRPFLGSTRRCLTLTLTI